jgi:hypothetical protein
VTCGPNDGELVQAVIAPRTTLSLRHVILDAASASSRITCALCCAFRRGITRAGVTKPARVSFGMIIRRPVKGRLRCQQRGKEAVARTDALGVVPGVRACLKAARSKKHRLSCRKRLHRRFDIGPRFRRFKRGMAAQDRRSASAPQNARSWIRTRPAGVRRHKFTAEAESRAYRGLLVVAWYVRGLIKRPGSRSTSEPRLAPAVAAEGYARSAAARGSSTRMNATI